MRIGFMLHSVLSGVIWDYSFLATSMEELSHFINNLKGRGYKFIFANEWATAQDDVVSISFDDGYLDNWTILFPWMAENKIKFSVFVNREFVENSSSLRPFGWQLPGYLNIGEIREMALSGWVDIQSHSCTHTWYPTGPRVVDIYHSSMKHKYPWVQWNNDVSRKPYWLAETNTLLDGIPVFENDRSLRAVRFLVGSDVLTEFREKVCFTKLSALAASTLFEESYSVFGRYETYDEQKRRYYEEIVVNMDFIEGITGLRPNVLCWPGGAYNALSESVAKSLQLVTTTGRGYGVEDGFLHRISPSNPYAKDRWPWRDQALTLNYYLARFQVKGLVYRLSRRIQGD